MVKPSKRVASCWPASTARISRQIDSAFSVSFRERSHSTLASGSAMPAFEINFSCLCMSPPAGRTPPYRNALQKASCSLLCAENLAHHHGERIVELIHDAFFQRDDGVVRDVNVFGTDFRATFGDVAEADAQLVFEQRSAIRAIERMHLEPRNAHEKARPAERFLLVMIAQDVANVLAQEAFDAFAEFLHAVHVHLRNLPFHVRLR